MATINYDSGEVLTIPATVTTAGGAGAGRLSPVLAQQGAGVTKIISGTITGDSSYPTGGEDISDIYNYFTKGTPYILVEALPKTADTGVIAKVDNAAKKLMLFTALAVELGAGVTWANTTVRFVAIGTA